MKKGLFILLLLISNIVFAEKIKVTCWSGKHKIFRIYVEDVFYNENILGVVDKGNTYFIFADCIVQYRTKDLYSQKTA